MIRRRVPLAALACLATAAAAGPPSTTPVAGPRDRSSAATIAFVHAEIVAAPGRRISDGTLVVRDGRIVAVGPAGTVPADAVVIDLAGKLVYPGLVDPYTEYGLPAPDAVAPPEAGAEPRYEGSRDGAAAWNDAVRADRDWVASFEPDTKAARPFLERGVTTVQSARLDGVFRGRGFVASLAPGLPNERVLEPYGPHFAAFGKGSSRQRYPTSLMGSIALVRQTLLDARWYSAAREAFRRNPDQPMPEFNRGVRALAGLEGPLVFDTGDELSLLRAARISREFSIPMIHVGTLREWKRIDEIAGLGQPLILPLDLPVPPDVSSRDAALDVSLAELRHWERAPSTPALLERRGVRFAFTAHGLKKPEAFWNNVRRVVRRGLTADGALAALTTEAATLAGVADRLGTLEAGKRADFFVADGDPFDDAEARVLSVWISGEPVLETVPLDQVDFRGVHRLSAAGREWELRLRGPIEAPRGELLQGERRIPLEGVEVTPRQLAFRAVLDESERGVSRFTIVDLGASRAGRVALPGGSDVALAVQRTADRAPAPDDEEVADPAEDPDEDRAALSSRLTYPAVAFGRETPPARENLLLRGATLWTASERGVLRDADLLVLDGRIAGVGPGLAAPRGARVVDARGLHVTPGLIDEHSHMAIDGGVNEGSHAVTAEVRIGDVVDPADVAIYRALAGGVTTAQLLHGSANPIGGQSRVIKLRWGAGPDRLELQAAPPTIKFALGENVKQSNRSGRPTSRYPRTRMGVEALLRDAFLEARDYERRHREYAALSATARTLLVPPRRDLQLEALLEVLRSERFVHCHSYVQSEILMLMRLAEEFGFRIQTFTHVLEGYKVAPEIAAHGAGASSFSDWWAYKFEVYDAIPYNVCLLQRSGVVASVNSDSSEVVRRLNQEAAKSVMYCGMDEHDALRLVTSNPAIQLRVAERVGSLTPGKDADFVRVERSSTVGIQSRGTDVDRGREVFRPPRGPRAASP